MIFFNQIIHATEKSPDFNVVQNKHFKPSKLPEISPVVEMTIEAVDVLRSALNSKSNLASELVAAGMPSPKS